MVHPNESQNMRIWSVSNVFFSQILSFDFSICVRAFLSLFGLPVALTQFVYLLKLLLWVSRDRVSTSLSSPNSISSIYSHFLASAHPTSIIIYRFQLNLSNIYTYFTLLCSALQWVSAIIWHSIQCMIHGG